MIPIVHLIDFAVFLVVGWIARHFYLAYRNNKEEMARYFFKFSLAILGMFFFLSIPLFTGDDKIIVLVNIISTFFLFLSLGYFSSIPLSLTGRFVAADVVFFFSVAIGILITIMRLTLPLEVEPVIIGNFIFYPVFKESWEYLSQGIAASVVAAAGVYFFLSESRLAEKLNVQSRFRILAVAMFLLFLAVIFNYILVIIIPEQITQVVAASSSLMAFVVLFFMLLRERYNLI